MTARGPLIGAALAVAGGAALGLAAHALGDASFRPLPLLDDVASGIAIGLVVWIGTLVLRREGPGVRDTG